MVYLTEEELKTLLDGIDTSKQKGRRNLTILTLLYDTAARSSEIINLKVEDIHLEEKYIVLTGKGNKQRIVPIMKQTRQLLINYMKENCIEKGYLFNNYGKTMNERFIRDIIKSCNKLNKKISPHTFRHTRAIHLLDKGVNIIYIQELLGHTSVNTTMEYTKTIEKSKFKAIEKVNSHSKTITKLPDWNNDLDLLNQLLNL